MNMKKIMLMLITAMCFALVQGQVNNDTTVIKVKLTDSSAIGKIIKVGNQKKTTIVPYSREYWDSVNISERKKYNDEIYKKFGLKLGKQIVAGEIRIGYTETMVEYAWGSPDDYIYKTTKNGKIVTWVYKRQKALLGFKNKKLVSIIE
jgi:hypothetical protein